MAYLGLAPVTNFLTTFSETFSGDDNTRQFILTRSVSRAEDLEVFVGSTQQLPSAFTASGTALTFNSAPVSGTNNIYVIYRAGALQALDTTRVGNPAGSASSPSLYYTNGSDTGIYWPSASKLGFSASGASRVIIDAATASSSTTTGALQVAGGVGLTGNLYAGGIVRFSDATDSASTSTGAAVFSGGLGVAKNLNVGGDIQVTGDFTVAGTFTTTASDSLAINDPFLFLATNNTGDSLDTGFVAKYNNGTDRYTGFFRDVTTGKYTLFANLTNAPTTTVDTANVSYSLADLDLRSLTSTGTIFATANTAASSTTTGTIQVTGGVGVAGDIYAESLNLGSGSITTTGAIGNVSTITAASTIQTVGRIYANANVVASSTTNGALVIPNNGGLSVGGNVTLGGNVNATSGNLYVGNIIVSGTNGSAVTLGNLVNGGGSLANVGQNGTTFNYGYFNYLTGTLVTAAQTNVTSLGTLSGLTVSGAIVPSSNAAINIGSTSAWFATLYATANQARYADLAENYSADAEYEPGTVVDFGGEQEITLSVEDHSRRIAGVISTNPAYLMNGDTPGLPVALQGRVPCKVVGSVRKGDMMVSAGNGRARAEDEPKLGAVIGKALENFDGLEGVIEVVIGRN